MEQSKFTLYLFTDFELGEHTPNKMGREKMGGTKPTTTQPLSTPKRTTTIDSYLAHAVGVLSKEIDMAERCLSITTLGHNGGTGASGCAQSPTSLNKLVGLGNDQTD